MPIPDPERRTERRVVSNDEIKSPVRALGYVPPVREYREIEPGHLVQAWDDEWSVLLCPRQRLSKVPGFQSGAGAFAYRPLTNGTVHQAARPLGRDARLSKRLCKGRGLLGLAQIGLPDRLVDFCQIAEVENGVRTASLGAKRPIDPQIKFLVAIVGANTKRSGQQGLSVRTRGGGPTQSMQKAPRRRLALCLLEGFVHRHKWSVIRQAVRQARVSATDDMSCPAASVLTSEGRYLTCFRDDPNLTVLFPAVVSAKHIQHLFGR